MTNRNLSNKNRWWTISFHQLLTTTLQLIGFIFVVTGIQLNTKSLNRNLYFEMSKLSYETDKLFIEHPEFRPYFYDGKDLDSVKNDTFYLKAVGISELLLDYFDTMNDMNYLSFNDTLNQGWRNWVEGSFETSPILVKTLTENKNWYPQLNLYYENWKKTKK